MVVSSPFIFPSVLFSSLLFLFSSFAVEGCTAHSIAGFPVTLSIHILWWWRRWAVTCALRYSLKLRSLALALALFPRRQHCLGSGRSWEAWRGNTSWRETERRGSRSKQADRESKQPGQRRTEMAESSEESEQDKRYPSRATTRYLCYYFHQYRLPTLSRAFEFALFDSIIPSFSCRPHSAHCPSHPPRHLHRFCIDQAINQSINQFVRRRWQERWIGLTGLTGLTGLIVSDGWRCDGETRAPHILFPHPSGEVSAADAEWSTALYLFCSASSPIRTAPQSPFLSLAAVNLPMYPPAYLPPSSAIELPPPVFPARPPAWCVVCGVLLFLLLAMLLFRFRPLAPSPPPPPLPMRKRKVVEWSVLSQPAGDDPSHRAPSSRPTCGLDISPRAYAGMPGSRKKVCF